MLSAGPSSQDQVEVVVFQDPRKKQKTRETPAPRVVSVRLLYTFTLSRQLTFHGLIHGDEMEICPSVLIY